MDNRDLLRWGSWSAHISVLLLVISIAAYWITGGLEFRAWVPLFSTFAAFLGVATIATYEYLARYQYSLARAGLPFAALTILTFFLEAVVWGADRMVIRGGGVPSADLSPLLALFNSLHMLVLWLIAFWMILWGLGLTRVGGKAKVSGVLMTMVAGFHIVDYVFARTGQAGLHVELWHLGSQACLLGSFIVLGFVLRDASDTTP